MGFLRALANIVRRKHGAASAYTPPPSGGGTTGLDFSQSGNTVNYLLFFH